MGDQLDRGDQEVPILYFLERLQREAARAGGALHILNGNHETLNIAGRFRYATPGGMTDFLRHELLQRIGDSLKVGTQQGCIFLPSLQLFLVVGAFRGEGGVYMFVCVWEP